MGTRRAAVAAASDTYCFVARKFTSILNPMDDHAAPFYSPFGRTSRLTYVLRSAILLGLVVGAIVLNRGDNVAAAGVLLVVSLILWLFNIVTRGNDAGWPWWLSVGATLLFNLLAATVLAIVPTREGFGPSRVTEFKPSRLP